MKIKIFNCHHIVPDVTVSNELFATLISGLADAADGSYLGDLGGGNIAGFNVFSELRHQYYVWKNHLGAYDYVGFEHYRRMFFIDPMPAARLREICPDLLEFRRSFQSEQAKSHLDVGPVPYAGHWEMRRAFDRLDVIEASRQIASYDIIVQRSSEPRTMEEQWKSCMPVQDWDHVVHAFEQARYIRDRGCLVDFQLRSPVWNNMYIMRASLFHEYMELLMDCVEYLSRHMHDPWHRAWGHCGERIFNFYLFQKAMERPQLRVGRLPYILHSPAYVKAHANDVADHVTLTEVAV